MREQEGGEDARYGPRQSGSEAPSGSPSPAESPKHYGWPPDADRHAHAPAYDPETPWQAGWSYGPAPPQGYPSPGYGPPPSQPGAGYVAPHGEYGRYGEYPVGYGVPPPQASPSAGYPPHPQGQPGGDYPPPPPIPGTTYGRPPPYAHPGGGGYGLPPSAQPGAAYGHYGGADQQGGYPSGPPAGGYGSYAQYPNAGYGYGYGPPPWRGPSPAVPNDPSAICALVLAIASYPLMSACGAGIITLVVSFVMATQAQHKIETSGGIVQGAGLVRAAMVLNWILLGLVIIVLVTVSVALAGMA